MTSARKNATKPTRISIKKAIKKMAKKTGSSNKIIFHADTNQTQHLIEAGKRSAAQAIRESQALGLEIMYIEDGILYREKDGQREAVQNKTQIKFTKDKILKKGATLYVKK